MKLNKSKENKINNDKKGKSKSECFTVQTKTVDQSQFSVWFAIFYSTIELLPYKSTELVRDFTWRLFIEQILSCFWFCHQSWWYLNCVFWNWKIEKFKSACFWLHYRKYQRNKSNLKKILFSSSNDNEPLKGQNTKIQITAVGRKSNKNQPKLLNTRSTINTVNDCY